MRCNYCLKTIPKGEELKEKGKGSWEIWNGYGEGSYEEGGYYHRKCWLTYREARRFGMWKLVAWFVFLGSIIGLITMMVIFVKMGSEGVQTQFDKYFWPTLLAITTGMSGFYLAKSYFIKEKN